MHCVRCCVVLCGVILTLSLSLSLFLCLFTSVLLPHISSMTPPLMPAACSDVTTAHDNCCGGRCAHKGTVADAHMQFVFMSEDLPDGAPKDGAGEKVRREIERSLLCGVWCVVCGV